MGLIVDTAASPSVDALQVKNNGTKIILMFPGPSSFISLESQDNNAGRGPVIFIDRNNDGVTPAAGSLGITDKGNQLYYIWPDDSGDVRIHTSSPTNANDGAGVVVGDQSSWHEAKDILGPALPAEDAVRSVAALVFDRFAYKETGYNQWDGSPPEFNGLVVRDRKDWWGKNCGPHQTPALNEIELFGRYGLTIQKLIEEVQALGGFQWL